jgi:hypothetical protein
MPRRTIACAGALSLALLMGCEQLHSHRVVAPPGCEPVFSQYHHHTFRWSEVNRVLVLPFSNESKYGRTGPEVAEAFRAELQQIGRFEVIAAPPDDIARLSNEIHRYGQFDEGMMLKLAKDFKADVVIHGAITQYSPYPRPRLGIVVQAVSPREGKVVGSVDGLWDANHLPIAKRAQNYYTQRTKQRGPYLQANVIFDDDGHGDELVLLSPQLYQRWVSSELVAILVQSPHESGEIFAPKGTKAMTPTPSRMPWPAVPEGVPVASELPRPTPVAPKESKEPPRAIPPAVTQGR